MTIPAEYIPTTDKPWRVSWGFGAFRDFATKDEAQKFYEQKVETSTGDWKALVDEPFDAVAAFVA